MRRVGWYACRSPRVMTELSNCRHPARRVNAAGRRLPYARLTGGKDCSMRPKITPFLWFDHQAEEATRFYTSTFKNSEILSINRMGDGDDAPVFTTSFRLDGQE